MLCRPGRCPRGGLLLLCTSPRQGHWHRSPGVPRAPVTTVAPGWRPGRPSRRSRPAPRGEHTFTDASSRSATNFSKASCLAATSPRSVFAHCGQLSYREHPVFWLCRGVDEREHQVGQVTDLAVTGQESLPPEASPLMPSRARQVPANASTTTWPPLLGAAGGRRRRAAAARRKGRGLLGARGRPVGFFMSSSSSSATPELSITSVQKEIASSLSAELEAGTGRPWLIFAQPLAQLGFGTWRPGDVAGITQQRLDLCDPGYIKQ